MNSTLVLLGISVVLAVAAVGVSLFSVWRSQLMVLAADQRSDARMKECEATTLALRRTLDNLAEEMRELRRGAASTLVPAIPRPGLNLSRRSQVLRMHRKGDPPDQIAAALDVPLQEVDLLIKVHGIVINSI